MDTLIIGGGPAGLMAACFCAGQTLVIDRLKAPGRKLLTTGGGRCNLTHATNAEGIQAAFGRQARFVAPALRAFSPDDIRRFFRRRGVETCETDDGCVFPVSQKAADVLAVLERAARAQGTEIRCNVRARKLLIAPVDPSLCGTSPSASLGRVIGVETDQGILHARRVILAAGGQSYPGLGSDGSGFALARAACLSIVQPVPALAGLVTQEKWPATLTGIVLPDGGLRLDVKGAPKSFLSGALLFTHKGVSGPPALALSGEIAARLQADAARAEGIPVRVSFRADRTVDTWRTLFERWRRERGGRALHNLLSGELPRALATALCELAGTLDTAVARARKDQLETLARTCAECPLHIVGTEGWDRAMLTRGGVAVAELDAATLACKRLEGLFCAGEVIDVDAPCGGYNLTWAFASGRLAGMGCD